MTTDKPIYLTLSDIARELGIPPANIARDFDTWHHDPVASCPDPDAYHQRKDGHLSPLYTPARLPDWRDWEHRRRIIGQQRRAASRRNSTATDDHA